MIVYLQYASQVLRVLSLSAKYSTFYVSKSEYNLFKLIKKIIRKRVLTMMTYAAVYMQQYFA